MEKLTPEDLRDIFIALQNAGLDAIVVGGQAVNLWAYQYLDSLPQLAEHLPFASEDLDFYGGRVEATLCHDILGGQLNLNRDFDPSPNAGVVLVNWHSRQLRIDILASLYGLNDAEIDGTAQQFIGKGVLSDIFIKVLHPILCLEGKLRCLRGLPQHNRQDLKHVQILLWCAYQFLSQMCQQPDPRPSLKLLERLIGSALREDGLYAWFHHQILLEQGIPIEIIQRLSHEKWQRFYQQRWPQLLESIESKRQRYAKICDR
jgi:hypothetical protein